MKLCSFKGCNKPYCAKGLCNTHWAQQKRYGELTPIVTKETAEERFERQTIKTKNGCWTFTGNGKGSGKSAVNGEDGYGQLYFKGKKFMAHRFSYEKYVGPIPSGYQIDHLCRNKKCVNPEHLQIVTQDENMRRLHFAKSLLTRIEILENFITTLGYNPNNI